ncbi:hypothetical protein ACI394_30255, partial [Klebsiella pneumoniae]|uniref:hypothetical protein n=1 Tax=Klebsiella pneumoniae TaxID=573 RepID=UPI003851B3F2
MNYLEAIKQIDGKFILAHYNKVYQTLFYYPVHGDEIYQNFTMRISDLLDNDWILVLKENAFYV